MPFFQIENIVFFVDIDDGLFDGLCTVLQSFSLVFSNNMLIIPKQNLFRRSNAAVSFKVVPNTLYHICSAFSLLTLRTAII